MADRRDGGDFVGGRLSPGEEGGRAVADVLAGTVNPSGRLPVQLPRSAGAQPTTYLHTALGAPSDVTAADPTPVRPFGFGLSYTTFEHSGFEADAEGATDGRFTAAVTVTNTGEVAGTDVVQLYGRDVHATVARPVAQLLGYVRVPLEPGESRRVVFDVPAARFAFTDLQYVRVVEPGTVEVWVGDHAEASSAAGPVDTEHATGGAITNVRARARRAVPGTATPRARVELVGDVHRVTTADPRTVDVVVTGRAEEVATA